MSVATADIMREIVETTIRAHEGDKHVSFREGGADRIAEAYAAIAPLEKGPAIRWAIEAINKETIHSEAYYRVLS